MDIMEDVINKCAINISITNRKCFQCLAKYYCSYFLRIKHEKSKGSHSHGNETKEQRKERDKRYYESHKKERIKFKF